MTGRTAQGEPPVPGPGRGGIALVAAIAAIAAILAVAAIAAARVPAPPDPYGRVCQTSTTVNGQTVTVDYPCKVVNP